MIPSMYFLTVFDNTLKFFEPSLYTQSTHMPRYIHARSGSSSSRDYFRGMFIWYDNEVTLCPWRCP
jgi:hypothetical protein